MSKRFGLRFVPRLVPWLVLGAGLVAMGLTTAACSFFIDLSTDQCETTADCTGRSGGQSLVCNAGTCEAVITIGDDGGSDAEARPCATNAECNGDAAAFARPYICDRTGDSGTTGQCIPLLAPDDSCAFVYPQGEATAEGAVYFAAFMPILNQAGPNATPLAFTYQLALDELAAAGGIPGGANGVRRSLVALFCDSTPEVAPNAVKHLTKTLHIPAVIPLFSQTDMTKFVQDDFVPNGVFVLNPQDTTETLKAINTNNLVWHLLGDPSVAARAYKPLVARTETYVKSRSQFGSPSTLKLAIVATNSPTEKSIVDVMRNDPKDGIVFNGKTPGDNGDATFKYIELPSAEINGVDPTKYAGQIADLRAWGPNVVILLTSSLEVDPFLVGYEASALDAGASTDVMWLLGPRNASTPVLLDFVKNYFGTDAPGKTFESRQTRMLGIQYAGDANKLSSSSQYNQYMARFKAAHPETSPADYASKENYYDAIYWLAYGLTSAGFGAPSEGSSFGTGVRKLLSGPDIYPGSARNIAEAMLAITSSFGGTTYQGAMGKPDFNLQTGAANSVGAVYCYSKDASGLAKPTYDSLRYDPATGEFTGDLACFIGF